MITKPLLLNETGLEIAKAIRDTGRPTDTQVNNWLNSHPEATTTVQDGAITEDKLNFKVVKRRAVYFNSVLEMKESTILKDCMYACTAGYNEPNDLGGALYRVRVKTDSDIVDNGILQELSGNLVAEIIVENNKINTLQLNLDKDDTNGTNLQKLGIAINRGLSIDVLDMYSIKNTTTQVCNKDIIITSTRDNCGFDFSNSPTGINYIFSLTNSIKVVKFSGLIFKNIISNEGLEHLVILTWWDSSNTNILDMTSYSCEYCNFIGSISLIRHNYSPYTDEASLPCIQYIKIYTNTLTDCSYSWATFDNILFNICEFIKNHIYNFKHTVLAVGIENEPENATQWQIDKYTALAKGMKDLIVTDNYTYNDDNCVINDNSGTYYCVILAETQTCYFVNNHTEGIKAYRAAVYDCYLSCVKVVYKNNVWKNNICYGYEQSEWDIKNNAFIKCKGSNDLTSMATRVYSENHFETTEDFVAMLVSKYGAKRENCWVQLANITSLQDIKIINNTFDVALIRFFTSNTPARVYIFENNIINATDCIHSYLYSVYSYSDIQDIVTKFNNNTINVTGILSNTDPNNFYIVFYNNPANYPANIETMNNIINAPTYIVATRKTHKKDIPVIYLVANNTVYANSYDMTFTQYDDTIVKANTVKYHNIANNYIKNISLYLKEDIANSLTVDQAKITFLKLDMLDGVLLIENRVIDGANFYSYKASLQFYTLEGIKYLKMLLNGTEVINSVLYPTEVKWFNLDYNLLVSLRPSNSDNYLIIDNKDFPNGIKREISIKTL